MAVEKPLDIEKFFMSRNEIATKHNSKLEFLAMDRAREALVNKQKEQALAKEAKATATAKKK